MLSQNVLNLVDAAMVGTLGDAALAGVGLASILNWVLAAFILGLSAGVQAMASRRVGEGREDISARPLNGGLLLGMLIAIPWSAFLVGFAPEYFALLVDDPLVVAEGVPYLQVRLLAMTGLAMNFCFRGYWNATNRPMLYMSTLILMHAVNVALNWVFIFGNLGAPALGSMGAGLASAISVYVGTLFYLSLGLRFARGSGFLAGIPERETLRTMLRLSVPAGMQQVFYALGALAFLAIVARIGTAELGASHVILQLTLVGVLPAMGFGLAAASLVGQALGAGAPEDAVRWGWEVTRLAMAVVAIISIPAIVAPEWVLSAFLREPSTLALAVGPLRIVALFMVVDAVGFVLMNALVGAGDTRRVMYVATSLQWGLFLPVVALVGPVFGGGLLAVYASQVAYRLLQSAAFAWMWRGRAWQRISV